MPKIVRNEVEFSSTTSTANQVQYNNTVSGLSATNVQNAIDEIAQGGGGGGGTASAITYDNTESGLLSTNVQDAIDEVVEDKADKVTPPPEYDPTSTYSTGDFVTYNGDIYMCMGNILTPEPWNVSRWKLIDGDSSYLHSLNPSGGGSFSLNRKANTTTGFCSFAEGCYATASSHYSHAEGYSTTASGSYSHSEGYRTTASNSSAHAEGDSTTASGFRSHAEGSNTVASGNFGSHAEGYYTIANHRAQHAFGEYNVADPSTALASARGNYIEIVGNGTSDARSNARTLDWNGNEVLAGGLKINGTQDVATINEVNSKLADTSEANALYHLGFYLDENGGLCQVNTI